MAATGPLSEDQLAEQMATSTSEDESRDQQEGHVVQQSPLLRLPPELRNRIYEYALVEKDMIQVWSTKTRPPSLLATCKTIRFFALWQKHFLKYKSPDTPTNIRVKWEDKFNWYNVMECCEILFKAGVMFRPLQTKDEFQAKIWIVALEMVYDGLKCGKTWEETKRTLKVLYRALKVGGPTALW